MRELSISSKTFRIAGIVFCLAILTGELSYLSTALIHVSDTLLLILITLLLFGTVCTIAEPARANCLAYTMVFGSVTLFWLLEFAKKRIEITGVHEACAKYGLIALAAMTMLWFVNCGRQYERDGIALTSQIKDGWKNYLPVIVICAIYILLYIPNFNVWFKIDSYTYYSSVADNAGKWSFTFSDMAALRMGGHNTYAYSILMTIGQLLVSRNGIGQRLVNLGLSIITIVTFYGITLKIWDDNIRRSTLLTGVFSVSPLMLGISYLVSTDFPLLCFFTILIYASIRGDKFFEYMMVYAVCFTKETGLIFVTAFYLTRYLIVNKGNLLAALKRVPIQRVMFAALPILLYAAILLLGSGGWSKNFREAFHNAAEVNYDVPADAYVWWHYPIYKCFEYFVMNFYWLSLVLIVVDAIAIKMSCAKNGIRIREYLAARCESKMFFYLPALVTYFAFCTIGIAYFTYIHYRYVQLGHLFYVLNLGILIDLLPFEESKRELLLVPLMVLFAVESYFTVDPFTYTLLRSFDAGNGSLVSTREYWYITIDDENDVGYYWEASDEIMSQFNVTEGVEYNRECLGLQKALESAFESMDITPDTLIVIDRFGAWDSLACAELLGVMDTNGYYWDSSANTVTRSETDIPLQFGFSDNDFDTEEYDKVYYLELKLNNYYEDELDDAYDLEYLDTQAVGRWSVGIYRVIED